MLCVLILYISGGTYSLKSTPNDRFVEKLFMAILFTLRVFARNLLRGNRRRNTFRISFWCLAWDSNPGFSSNKPTHYLLDHGDFKLTNIQTYIYIIGHYNPLVRITIWFLTPSLLLCVLIYNLKSTPNDRFWRNFLYLKFIHSQRFWQKSADRKYFFIFRSVGDAWPGI